MHPTQIKYNKEDEEIILKLSIARISFLRIDEKRILQKNIDNPYNLALLSIEEIEKLVKRNFSKKVIWKGNDNLDFAIKTLFNCRRFGIKFLFIDDFSYPSMLKEISDPPFLLFCRGDYSLLNKKCVSVVGTRKLTMEGKKASLSFSYDAAKDGVNVVSGLARGADAAVHQGAVNAYFDYIEQKKELSSLGKTIAVLPSGIDNIFPVAHKKLAENILKSGGCIISEYEPGEAPQKYQFVARNRIIAGLSDSTLVVEAPPGSGALITADFALDYGRDVYFHKAAFSSPAMAISKQTKLELSKLFATGRVSKYKLENTPKKYLDAGAPVVNDYQDFCLAKTESPGSRSFCSKQEKK